MKKINSFNPSFNLKTLGITIVLFCIVSLIAMLLLEYEYITMTTFPDRRLKFYAIIKALAIIGLLLIFIPNEKEDDERTISLKKDCLLSGFSTILGFVHC